MSVTASANVLQVGPTAQYKRPSQAAAVAQTGDTVVIAPGRYADCAVWAASNLTIAGGGADTTTVTNRSCIGKGVFVVTGNNVTIRDIALEHASVPDMNGAGIRAEGVNLLVQRVHLVADQDGILADPVANSTITVQDSVFANDGICSGDCAHGIYIGAIAQLNVQHSTFRNIHQGHCIKSRAAVTNVTDSTVEDGPTGTSSYLIDAPNGGAVTISGNYLEKGPASSNPYVAISIGEEGVTWTANSILVQDNSFRNDGTAATTFLVNDTKALARLIGNTMSGSIGTVLQGPGSVTQ